MALEPIPYSELREGFYWGRREKDGEPLEWHIFLVRLNGSSVLFEDLFKHELKPTVAGRKHAPESGNGLFFYERIEEPDEA